MATIAPGRLHDVSNAADFVALTETNFEILTSEVFKQEPTYVAGVPTTTVGPPISGAHVFDEAWRDALGGVWKCTVAGTPGTWKQILLTAVTADRFHVWHVLCVDRSNVDEAIRTSNGCVRLRVRGNAESLQLIASGLLTETLVRLPVSPHKTIGYGSDAFASRYSSDTVSEGVRNSTHLA